MTEQRSSTSQSGEKPQQPQIHLRIPRTSHSGSREDTHQRLQSAACNSDWYTCRQPATSGRSMTFLARQASTKSRKLRDQSPAAARDGESFCAMWYKALIAFMLNSGGRLSANTHAHSCYQRNQLIPNLLPNAWVLKCWYKRLCVSGHESE